jgi:putrescine---pyruvate transaminase
MQREKLVEQVRSSGRRPTSRSDGRRLQDHPLVGEARNIGLMGALELVSRQAGTRRGFPEPGTVGTICRDICFENGLVMRAVRDTMIIAPPLVISHAEIDELVSIARYCLDRTLDVVGRQAPA